MQTLTNWVKSVLVNYPTLKFNNFTTDWQNGCVGDLFTYTLRSTFLWFTCIIAFPLNLSTWLLDPHSQQNSTWVAVWLRRFVATCQPVFWVYSRTQLHRCIFCADLDCLRSLTVANSSLLQNAVLCHRSQLLPSSYSMGDP